MQELVTDGDRVAMRFTEHGPSEADGMAPAAWAGIGLFWWGGAGRATRGGSPSASSEPGAVLPLVVHLHGGGWVGGSIPAADRPCRDLATAAHCVVAPVEYRLAPENPFPAPLRDCVAATRWLADHAAGC